MGCDLTSSSQHQQQQQQQYLYLYICVGTGPFQPTSASLSIAIAQESYTHILEILHPLFLLISLILTEVRSLANRRLDRQDRIVFFVKSRQLMTKVYPNASASAAASGQERPSKPVVLTVWKKSLLFNCEGFTVFDANGNLVFRVDNYMSGSKGKIVLMDASGRSLLTIRRKRLSLGDNWLVFEGEAAAKPRYSVRKHVNLLSSGSLAQVSSLYTKEEDSGSSSFMVSPKKNVAYEIEGSYKQRCCTIYDDKRRRVAAEIKRKVAIGGVTFGTDVFHLMVYEPEIDSAVAMALVILLDQMSEFPTSIINPCHDLLHLQKTRKVS